jgi:hypothetical protein
MIDVSKFVAVSGIGGVQKLVAVRNNGLIIEDFDSKQRKFVPVRSHEFSPFETIQIYVDTEEQTIPLAGVLTKMKEQADKGNTPPSEKSESDELRDYFISILPDHDRFRVKISDIKKMIKWFNFLNSRNLLKEKVEETAAENAENTEGGETE